MHSNFGWGGLRIKFDSTDEEIFPYLLMVYYYKHVDLSFEGYTVLNFTSFDTKISPIACWERVKPENIL